MFDGLQRSEISFTLDIDDRFAMLVREAAMRKGDVFGSGGCESIGNLNAVYLFMAAS